MAERLIRSQRGGEGRGWDYKPLVIDTLSGMLSAFFGGQCQAIS
jgi:hypothetical protein